MHVPKTEDFLDLTLWTPPVLNIAPLQEKAEQHFLRRFGIERARQRNALCVAAAGIAAKFVFQEMIELEVQAHAAIGIHLDGVSGILGRRRSEIDDVEHDAVELARHLEAADNPAHQGNGFFREGKVLLRKCDLHPDLLRRWTSRSTLRETYRRDR